MFATLHGGLPVPPPDPSATPSVADPATLVAAAVAAQLTAGLEPVTDGDLALGDPGAAVLRGLAGIEEPAGGAFEVRADPRWHGPILVEAWRLAADAAAGDGAPRAAKARLPGPFSLARSLTDVPSSVERLALGLAEALNHEIRALEAAGCPLVQVDEPALVEVGEDPVARRTYAEAQRRLLEGTGVHAMLAIVGGNADRAGAATVFDAPYASLLVDLIAGPDNWRLVRQAPADRGIVCGVVPAEPGRRIDPPVLLWAAQYAASSNGRGLTRVGLATAGSLAELPWDEAVARMRQLGEAARLAEAEPAAQRTRLDRRAQARPRRRLGSAVPVPPPDSRGRRPKPIAGAPDEPPGQLPDGPRDEDVGGG